MPADIIKELPEELETGIYFGWASVDSGDVFKAVLSLGWNPFFKNEEKSLVRIFFRSSSLFKFQLKNVQINF